MDPVSSKLSNKSSQSIGQMLAPMALPFVEAASVQVGEKVGIVYDIPHAELANLVAEEVRKKGATVEFCCRDLDAAVKAAKEMPINRIRELHRDEYNITRSSDRILLLRGNRNPEVIAELDVERRTAYQEAYSEAYAPRGSGKVPWLLTLPPTEYEANFEGISLEEYVHLYTNACNQPWAEIKKTQEILVEKLDRAETIQFIVNPNDPDPKYRTDISMSIKGMTFVNSVTARNFPGSEVFSAPVLDSVNGRIFAPGYFVHDGLKMKDIYLEVLNGKIVKAFAEYGNSALQEILGRGEGARYFGEVALGTNRGLKRKLLNELLVEKVSGSFHMAVGHCYSYKEYLGKPVKVDNGNTDDKTPVHWDLTVLMHHSNGGGRVLLDGKVIQEDGFFLDSKLALLNPVTNH